jgi:hypothetical protein
MISDIAIAARGFEPKSGQTNQGNGTDAPETDQNVPDQERRGENEPLRNGEHADPYPLLPSAPRYIGNIGRTSRRTRLTVQT